MAARRAAAAALRRALVQQQAGGGGALLRLHAEPCAVRPIGLLPSGVEVLPRFPINHGLWRALHGAEPRVEARPQPGAPPQLPQQPSPQENHQAQPAQQQPKPPQLFSAAGAPNPAAEACDRMLDRLQQAKDKAAQSRSSYNPYPVTLAERASKAARAAATGVLLALKFAVSLPSKLRQFAAIGPAARRDVYRGWWALAKKEAHHYWMGMKLLGTDVKIASRLSFKTLRGKTLTRRERRQLTRTIADVFRLVPFAVFVLVPFMELLLPVALKLFPNMLPSTFENKLKKEEEVKRRVTAKLEVARFLQDTVQEMAKDMKGRSTGKTQASASQLYDFMKRVRAGEAVSNYELMKFASLFNDELTLDNLERIHLVNLCRFVGIQPFGTDAFLASRLRHHLGDIKRDDRAIREEGLDALTEEELRAACRARGMRAPFGEGAVRFMQRQMTEWLDLSLNRSLPSSLLLLSRAFTVTQPVAKDKETAELESLKDTLSALPRDVIDEIALQRPADGTDVGTEYARKLEQLRREEELIQEEAADAEAALAGGAGPQRSQGQSTEQLAAAAAAAAVVGEAAASAVADALEGMSEEERAAKSAAAKEAKMRKVLSALTVLASSSGVTAERQAFLELVRTETERLHAQLNSKGSLAMVFRDGGVSVDRGAAVTEVAGQAQLQDKVAGILGRIERELDEADTRIGEAMHVLDLDNDGLVTRDELQTAMSFLKDQLGEEELRLLLERIDAFGDSSIDVSKLMRLADPRQQDEQPS